MDEEQEGRQSPGGGYMLSRRVSMRMKKMFRSHLGRHRDGCPGGATWGREVGSLGTGYNWRTNVEVYADKEKGVGGVSTLYPHSLN